jgi:tetraacyldisaccharide 4'-kinase
VNPLSALYGAGVGIRNRWYDRGTVRTYRLRAPVVSIGSISAGGAGKTPLLIMVGELLKRRGIAFDVLSRGYGRRTRGIALVDPAGTPLEFGDEPLLITRKLGVPVIVGEDRYAAGRFVEEKFGPQTHLLDDGFQHRRLERDVDIVLVTKRDVDDALLPIGRLREPVSSLARASVIVFMDGATSDGIPLRSGQHVWRVSRTIAPPEATGACFAFCGIARPEGFLAELRKAGIQLAGTREFRDHHRYDGADIKSLIEMRQQTGATAFITTEKDEVNLGEYVRQLQPIHIVPVHMYFESSPQAAGATPIEQICAVIRARNETPVRE